MIVIVREVCIAGARDFAGLSDKAVSDRWASAILIDCAFDLVGRCRGAPQKAVGKRRPHLERADSAGVCLRGFGARDRGSDGCPSGQFGELAPGKPVVSAARPLRWSYAHGSGFRIEGQAVGRSAASFLLSNSALKTIAVRGRHNVAASMKKTADVH